VIATVLAKMPDLSAAEQTLLAPAEFPAGLDRRGSGDL
jgi:hypothetical protein